MSHDKTSSKFSGEEKLLNSRLPPTIYTKILHRNTHLDTRCEVFFDECKRTLNFCRSSWFVWNFLDCTYSLHNVHISKLMFSKKATKMMKSSPSIWCLLSKCQPDGKDFFSFSVTFLQNMNFTCWSFWTFLGIKTKYSKAGSQLLIPHSSFSLGSQ